jgi:GXWXG protein
MDAASCAWRRCSGAGRARGVPTGHPFDGLLEALGWHGKRFQSPDETNPLVFEGGATGLFNANPALVPVSLAVRLNRLVRSRPMRVIGRRLVRMARTSKPRARLRMMEYGVWSRRRCRMTGCRSTITSGGSTPTR